MTNFRPWKRGGADGAADQFLRLVPAVIKGTAQRRLAAAEAAKLYVATKRQKGTTAAEAAVRAFLQQMQENVAQQDSE